MSTNQKNENERESLLKVPEKKAQTSHLGYSYYVLFVLFLIYVSNQWDRYILNYLYNVSTDGLTLDESKYQSLKNATGITSTEYGLLSGFGFTALYVVCGLFAGRITDLYNRKYVLAVGLTIWSLAVAGMGLATNFVGVLISRIVLGIGQAFSAPPSYSIISDYFPSTMRGQANGLYVFGIYVGGGLASISLVMTENVGWKLTCFIVGLLGIFFCLLLLVTVAEPERRQDNSKNIAKGNAISTVDAFIATFRPLAIRLLFVAAALRFIGGYAIGAFLPKFYSNTFPSHKTEYSLLNAAVVSTGGALSSYLGGLVSDKWSQKDRRARAFVPAIGALLGIPFIFGTLFIRNFYVSLVCLLFEYLFAECWFGPAFSLLQNELGAEIRGVASSAYIFITTVVGSLSPIVLGWVDENLNNIQWELFICVLISYGGCALVFMLLATQLQKTDPNPQPSLPHPSPPPSSSSPSSSSVSHPPVQSYKSVSQHSKDDNSILSVNHEQSNR